MTTSLLAPNTSHPAQTTSITIVSPGQEGARPTLPDTRVTEATIEDAYVNFILFCNPAVPLTADSAPLREAFRALPKSDGKNFRPFALFELIKQLENKELKTWADLAVKLGVTPPDQEKGQSSQKIQQYAVRLKRWMHSMHVNAFFDYLLGRKHTYWTQVPTKPDPICEGGRDGVAAEDDMALRALLPHIRPRRGRRKPEDDLNKPPSQRPRLASPSLNAEMRASRQDGLELWTAHPSGRGTMLFPPADQASSILPGPESGFAWASDASRTPLTAHPQSAMTPVHGQFWGDPAEPRSAAARRRHGAKVLSSAWRSGGVGAGGKPRGRPPNPRNTEIATPTISEACQELEASKTGEESSSMQPVQAATTPLIMLSPEAISPVGTNRPTPQASRPNRPGRLSLQVPQRASGSVRLATPPPALVSVEEDSTEMRSATKSSGTVAVPTPVRQKTDPKPDPSPRSQEGPRAMHHAPSGGRSSMVAVERSIMSDLTTADWVDIDGNKTAACGIDEAMALAKQIIEDLSSQAPTPDAFLRNVAALAGGSLLRGDAQVTVKRVEEGPTHRKYDCRWPLLYGSLRGELSFFETVAHDKWSQKPGAGQGDGVVGDTEDGQAARWKKKYEELLRATAAGTKQMRDLRTRVWETIRD